MKRLVFSLMIMMALLLVGCGRAGQSLVTAGGKAESRSVSGHIKSLEVTGIHLSLKGDNTGPRVELFSDGGLPRAELKGQQDVLDKLSFELAGDALKLSGPENLRFAISEELVLSLYNCSLDRLKLGGGCRFTAEAMEPLSFTADLSGASSATVGRLSSEGLKIDLSGASAFVIEKAELSGGMNLHISGASFLSLKGKGTELFAVITGASKVMASEFELTKTTLTVAGASSLECFVTELLGGSISGASEVYYKGSPELATSVGSSSLLEKR